MVKLRKSDASHLQADIDYFIDPTVLERLDDWALGRGQRDQSRGDNRHGGGNHEQGDSPFSGFQ